MSLRRSARNVTKSVADSTIADSHYVVAKSATKPTPTASKKRKSDASTASPEQVKKAPDSEFAVPKTPLSKKRKVKAAEESPAKALPFTPTPATVGLMASTSRSAEAEHPLDDLASLKPRPAGPLATNAPVLTPDGSKVVAYASSPLKSEHTSPQSENASPAKKRKAKELVPPDVGALRPPTATIDTLLNDAEAFLVKVDPKMKSLVEKHTCKIFTPEGLREAVDPFTALSSGIIGQQVSGQAAASIRKKFTALFPATHPSFPTPAQVLALDLPTLRTAGLSQRKAEYIHGLAEKFESGELTAAMLVSASDDELIEKLVAVRGLGRWSVEMFACFGLKRMDVFSTGDLGVQRGMATYMGRDISKLKAKGGKWKYMSEQEMLSIASTFSPYRSLFMWYMWRVVDVDVSGMQDGDAS
ncbi:HhH-GPD family base excision DNA repair protein [Dothidotthia symphoricarpi CBS 119687]|uniref:HhH-GPD family base excision DNA repair protein n=1 Tax=Dothidotthia symphoricarpi CBS 119687 TaxID=1392245 RepID=A0A6A6A6A0_9PLEO|nr:HhH-GPD family base excision DNA repair protein [Dothidotthia symphoricarpi CBS 119687]KAF2127360.1 HhH-GPD family base excision DNA repair protein [Dothidotthia symphoricarpi CBS 119687]